MIQRIKNWLDKGEGGTFYEPYVTNRDFVFITLMTLIVGSFIIFGVSLT